jgi:hypothetical protein
MVGMEMSLDDLVQLGKAARFVAAHQVAKPPFIIAVLVQTVRQLMKPLPGLVAPVGPAHSASCCC